MTGSNRMLAKHLFFTGHGYEAPQHDQHHVEPHYAPSQPHPPVQDQYIPPPVQEQYVPPQVQHQPQFVGHQHQQQQQQVRIKQSTPQAASVATKKVSKMTFGQLVEYH